MSKFQDETCEQLWDMSLAVPARLDGECGDVSEIGEWYGLLLDTGIAGAEHAILSEDDQGFVEYDVYDTEEQAREEFERIESEIAAEASAAEEAESEREERQEAQRIFDECIGAALPVPYIYEGEAREVEKTLASLAERERKVRK